MQSEAGLRRCEGVASDPRSIQHRLKLTQVTQGSMQDIESWSPSEVEDPKQLVLLRNVFRAANLIRRNVERKELSKAGRLHFQHSFGIVSFVKGDDVETQPI